MTSDDSMDRRPRGAHFSGSTDASVPAPPRAVPGPDETTAFIIAAGASSHGSVPGTADARDSDFAQRPASPDETAAFMVAAQYASAPASGSASVRADETAQFALLDGDLDEDAPLGWDDDLPVRHACGEAAEADDTFMFASLAEADGPSGAVGAPAQDPVSGDSAEEAEEDEASAEDVGRSAALMSGLVIVSRITGFFRTWAQAFGMGTTLVSSAFTVANNMHNPL